MTNQCVLRWLGVSLFCNLPTPSGNGKQCGRVFLQTLSDQRVTEEL